MEKSSFNPVAGLCLSNFGGISIELNNTCESVRYQWYDNKPSKKACEIKYTNSGRAYFRCKFGTFYLDQFMRF